MEMGIVEQIRIETEREKESAAGAMENFRDAMDWIRHLRPVQPSRTKILCVSDKEAEAAPSSFCVASIPLDEQAEKRTRHKTTDRT